jgi:tetratricopeptide (TPR) repeat protein
MVACPLIRWIQKTDIVRALVPVALSFALSFNFVAFALDKVVPPPAIPSKTAELVKIEESYLKSLNYARNDSGIKLVDAYIKQHETSSYAYYLKGLGAHCKAYSMFGTYKDTFKISKELRQAVKSYDDAYRLGLRSALLYCHRGEAQMALHMAQQTEINAKKRIKRDPQKDWVWAARGMIYAAIGDDSVQSRTDILVKRAIADLNQAIKLEPTLGAAWGARGMAYGAQGDFRKALSDTRKAISLCPNIPRLYYEHAVICMQIGAFASARQALNTAIKLEPGNPMTLLLRAQSALAMFDSKSAEADVAVVLKQDPSNAAALTLQSVIGMRAGQPEQAMADLIAADDSQNVIATASSGSAKLSAVTARQLLTKALSQYSSVQASSSPQALYEIGMMEFGLHHWSACVSRLEPLLAGSKSTASTEFHSAALCALAQYSLGKTYQAGAILDKYSRLTAGKGFAGAIMRYLAGQINESQLDALAKNTQDRTLANFYSGAKLARLGKLALAQQRLVWVQDHGDQHMDQYLLAVMELELLQRAKSGAVGHQ